MSDFWMVVADSSRVRFYGGASPIGTLTEVHEMLNERARMKGRDLVTDRPGRMHDDGQGRSATEHNAMDEELESFARQVANFLDKRRGAGDFTKLSIVAEPQFLGRLRKELTPATKNAVIETVSKNVTDDGPEAAQEYLSRITA